MTAADRDPAAAPAGAAPADWSAPTRAVLPIILIRGFGGLSVADERRVAYQGFNDGTVYPLKRGENYIYEGMVLRFLKSDWTYQDAANVVGYYSGPVPGPVTIPDNLSQRLARRLTPEEAKVFFTGDGVVVDAEMAGRLLSFPKPSRSLWVLRYYDLSDRKMELYARALVRLIDLIRILTAPDPPGPLPKVNIIAHSMGGLIVREAFQTIYPDRPEKADACVNKVVTLGTPHRGIAFQVLRQWLGLDASDELERFSPEFQEEDEQRSYKQLGRHFPLERFLTVVGTNYRSYGIAPASWLNRLFSEPGEFGLTYNRSDGLVKQKAAQIDGAPRTFVFKCHGGPDSLVTSRESFEIATRFFFGNIRARLRLLSADIRRGKDLFGKSEFFLGVCVKPRKVDFDLFHQSAEAENCYGPFATTDLSDPSVEFSWAGEDRLIWEGYLDVRKILEDASVTFKDVVIRLDFYVGERDTIGIGFSDNVIFRKQYYLRATLPETGLPTVYRHEDEQFAAKDFTPSPEDRLLPDGKGWPFQAEDAGFAGTFRLELDQIPDQGRPSVLRDTAALAVPD